MSNNRWHVTLAILNIIGFLGTVVVNALASILPLNNKTTGELSDQYPNLFVPVGLTFSIWGLIYILLAIYMVYQAVTAFKGKTDGKPFIEKIGIFFFLSSLANMAWIFAWHYEMVALSLVFMLFLLGFLLAIYLRLSIGKSDSSKAERAMVHLPFSIYLGWITVATIANATALLVVINWNAFGLGEQFWTVAVIIVGIALSLAMLFMRKDIFYCPVVDWALLGILLKRLAVNTAPDQAVVITAIAGLAIISLGIIAQLIRRKVY
ncbi:hypothetical protein ACFLXC_06500 [Chloroflexota bacterium]